jgi:tRNA pseudouridine38-40 synthase
MPRYKLTVAYEGTDFHGWQKQEPPPEVAAGPLRTVQGVLETAVREVVREPVAVVGASRTDAGVHALGQVAAFTSVQEIPLDRLPLAINSRLPPDVLVVKAEVVGESFDPISDALSKGYRYSIAHGGPERSPRPLFDRRFVYYTYHPLDAQPMDAAAKHLVGEHDFASFAQINHGRETTVRTIHSCSVESTAPDRCHIDVSGGGFLYNMVRIIAGTLVEVGRGRIEPDQVPAILAARDRRAAGPTLPPEGLCLMWVRYPNASTREIT